MVRSQSNKCSFIAFKSRIPDHGLSRDTERGSDQVWADAVLARCGVGQIDVKKLEYWVDVIYRCRCDVMWGRFRVVEMRYEADECRRVVG